MQEVKKISGALTQTLKEKDFQDTISNLGEVGLDSLLESGILKDIPILGTIVGLSRSAMTIQDKLFTKKLLTFLFQLKETKLKTGKSKLIKLKRILNIKPKLVKSFSL